MGRYTFEALTDALIAAGTTPPPFGLLGVAVGGTKIAQWLEWSAQAECTNVTCCDTLDCTQAPTLSPNPFRPITHEACPGNSGLYNGLIAPLVNTTMCALPIRHASRGPPQPHRRPVSRCPTSAARQRSSDGSEGVV